jgi:hypothetical protein
MSVLATKGGQPQASRSVEGGRDCVRASVGAHRFFRSTRLIVIRPIGKHFFWTKVLARTIDVISPSSEGDAMMTKSVLGDFSILSRVGWRERRARAGT